MPATARLETAAVLGQKKDETGTYRELRAYVTPKPSRPTALRMPLKIT
jgi:hypothetical protein